MAAKEFASKYAKHVLNWRQHPPEQREEIDAVLSGIGWIAGATANVRSGRLLDGHERLSLALEHNEPIPYTLVDLDADEEKQILAIFDAIGQMATVDAKKHSLLTELIAESQLARRERVGAMMDAIRSRRPIIPVSRKPEREATRPDTPDAPDDPREPSASKPGKQPRPPSEATLSFGKRSIPLSDDELATIEALYLEYVESHGDESGFALWLTERHGE